MGSTLNGSLYMSKWCEFFNSIEKLLDKLALKEFGPIQRTILYTRMKACGLESYPEVIGDPNGERCSGESICLICQNPYRYHPQDYRLIGYGNVPFLRILCDGRRVKL